MTNEKGTLGMKIKDAAEIFGVLSGAPYVIPTIVRVMKETNVESQKDKKDEKKSSEIKEDYPGQEGAQITGGIFGLGMIGKWKRLSFQD